MVALLFVGMIFPGFSFGQIPHLINYQGILFNLSSGQPVADNTYSITFSIYDASAGGSAIWSENQSVTTKNGLYDVLLGSRTALTAAILSGSEKYLGIKVGSDPEMTPLKRIVSVAYAIACEETDKVDGRHASEFADAAHNHDDRYFTETELNTSDGNPPNQGSNRMSWNNLTDVPNGFVDGTDNTAGGWIDDGAAVRLETSTDNVGIGTSSPNSKLEVAGSIHSTTGGFKFPDGTTQLTAATGGANSWNLTGNGSTTPGINFLGTTDDKALELKVNTLRALRLEPNTTSPNILGGYSGNTITAGRYGATIGGGGNSSNINSITGSYSTVSGGEGNTASSDRAVVGGGQDNTASSSFTTVGGGWQNQATGPYTVVSGGSSNTASGEYAAVGGGYHNTASGRSPHVAAGEQNAASAAYASVGGGLGNEVTAQYGTIAGCGRSDANDEATRNKVTETYGAIGGGGKNRAGNDNTNDADAPYATVSGGYDNKASSLGTFVGGGYGNEASNTNSAVAAGLGNKARGVKSFVGGGWSHDASGEDAAIGGGMGNIASGWGSTIGGGHSHIASGNFSTICGGINNDATSYAATVAGGSDNSAAGWGTVCGGATNTVSGEYAVIGGGRNNIASGYSATVPGGMSNTALGQYSFAGGRRAKANHNGVFVWADNTDADFSSAMDNEFIIRAKNGMSVTSNNTAYGGRVDNQTGGGDGFRALANVSNGLNWGALWAVNYGTSPALYAYATQAGYFQGNVTITGTLSKGGGGFKIDHPLDPIHKYLNHSFVESPDMKNVYDGVIELDSQGEAWVELPNWFSALNRDFCYQLTAIGTPGPDLFIAAEIANNRFKIAGGKAGMKVSWQVTGIRQDAFANAHRIPIEEDKSTNDRGKYMHPGDYGVSETMGIGYDQKLNQEHK